MRKRTGHMPEGVILRGRRLVLQWITINLTRVYKRQPDRWDRDIRNTDLTSLTFT